MKKQLYENAHTEFARLQTIDSFVPDLCNSSALVLVLLVSEVLVVLAAIMMSEGFLDWILLGGYSFFVQSVVLTSVACLCLSRPFLARMSLTKQLISAWLIILICFILLSGLKNILIPEFIASNHTEHFAKSCFVAASIAALVVRYFYLRDQWRRQRQAELSARIQALQARMRPHFLFNSLNSIASLIAIDPDKAEDAVLDLSELFRAALRNDKMFVRFEHELGLCEKYLSVEALRLGDRLSVEWNVSNDLNDFLIPPLTLQPLFENAIYHGIQPLGEGGVLKVESYEKKGFLYFVLSNPFREHEGNQQGGNKVALSNTRDRLQALFGETAILKTIKDNGTYTATLRLPVHKSAFEVKS